MASGTTTTLQSAIIDHFFRNTAETATQAYLALHSAAPTEGGTGAEMNNATTAPGYGTTRQSITFGAYGAGTANNTNTITYTATGTWNQIVGHSIWDNATVGSGNMLMFQDSVTGPTLANGDKYEFGADDISIALT